MNTIVERKKGQYSFPAALQRAQKQSAYFEEGLRIETAERIIDVMESGGVSRSELARRLNVSPAYITKVFRGHANLSLESLAKLAFALGMKWECALVRIDVEDQVKPSWPVAPSLTRVAEVGPVYRTKRPKKTAGKD